VAANATTCVDSEALTAEALTRLMLVFVPHHVGVVEDDVIFACPGAYLLPPDAKTSSSYQRRLSRTTLQAEAEPGRHFRPPSRGRHGHLLYASLLKIKSVQEVAPTRRQGNRFFAFDHHLTP
jgi:hypothetical protein